MPKTNRMQIKPGEIFERLMEQAKELTAKPVQNISDTVSSQSMTHMDEHYAVAKNEDIEGIVTLIKAQEAYFSKLSEVVSQNDHKIGHIESQLADQVQVLKEDNRQCATELKAIIEDNGHVDMDGLLNQQRAHTVEMDRMMMSLKTSIEKNIEKSKGVIEKKVEATSGQSRSIIRTTMVITILNTLCLIAYIAFDLLAR